MARKKPGGKGHSGSAGKERGSIFTRTAVVVAIITVAGTIIVAAIGAWAKPPEYPQRKNQGQEEFIALLESRASQITSALDQARDYETKGRFLELHHRNIEAIRANQLLVSQDSTTQIQALIANTATLARFPYYLNTAAALAQNVLAIIPKFLTNIF